MVTLEYGEGGEGKISFFVDNPDSNLGKQILGGSEADLGKMMTLAKQRRSFDSGMKELKGLYKRLDVAKKKDRGTLEARIKRIENKLEKDATTKNLLPEQLDNWKNFKKENIAMLSIKDMEDMSKGADKLMEETDAWA